MSRWSGQIPRLGDTIYGLKVYVREGKEEIPVPLEFWDDGHVSVRMERLGEAISAAIKRRECCCCCCKKGGCK